MAAPKLRSDFADWLSPILVKELRQGMRARAFVTSFLLLQGLMLLMAIIGLIAAARHEDTTEMSGLFWMMVAVPVLFIMPMAGLTAVSNEIKANTLELVFLTRLTARRIITGKWIALVSQIALLVCAVLPYAVLRYFLGGVNISTELSILGWMLLTAALLTGITIGISPYQSRLMRVFLTLGLVLSANAIFGGASLAFMGLRIFGGGAVSASALKWVVAGVLMALIALLLMLEVGATRIAPPAENHSWLKRVLSFVTLLLPFAFGRTPEERALFSIASLLMVTPFCIGALCEAPRFIPSLYRPFVRRGALARIFGRLLYPGWQSGMVFTFVALAIVFFTFHLSDQIAFQPQNTTGPYEAHKVHGMIILLALFGVLLMPAAIVRGFFPNTPRAMVLYLVVQIVCFLIFAITAMHDNISRTKWADVICIVPTCMLMLEMFGDSAARQLLPDPALRVWMMLIVTGLSLLALALRSVPLWRKIRALEKVAAEQKTPEPDDAAPRATVSA